MVSLTLDRGDMLVARTPDGSSPDPLQARTAIAGRSPTQIAFRRLSRDPVALTCFVIVVLFVLIAAGAPLWCDLLGVSTDTVRASTRVDLTTGLPKTGPPHHGFDSAHPFGIAPGTGNDNLAYWIYGARTSLFLAFVATVASTFVGVALGLVAGYAGGAVDAVIGFVTDIFLTFPFLLAALAISPIIADRFGTDIELYNRLTFWTLVGILVVFGWMGMTRLIRGEVLSLREREFVKAARVIGVPTRQILVREILPNLVAPIVVSISLGLPAFVAAEAGLSYLGIGVQGQPSWGQTIDGATKYWETYPLYLWEPVIGIAVLVVALNLLGDAIRDAFDPKTRRG
jgi:ABC-type dipeptide/oligopeptide/nickel transport system permease subunit